MLETSARVYVILNRYGCTSNESVQRSAQAQYVNISGGRAQLTVTGHICRLLRKQGEDIVGELLGFITAGWPRLLAASRAATSAGSVHTVSTSTLALQKGGILDESCITITTGGLGISEERTHTVAHGLPPSQRVRAARLQSWSARGHRSTTTSQWGPKHQASKASIKSDPTNPDSAGPGHHGGSSRHEVHEGESFAGQGRREKEVWAGSRPGKSGARQKRMA